MKAEKVVFFEILFQNLNNYTVSKSDPNSKIQIEVVHSFKRPTRTVGRTISWNGAVDGTRRTNDK